MIQHEKLMTKPELMYLPDYLGTESNVKLAHVILEPLDGQCAVKIVIGILKY